MEEWRENVSVDPTAALGTQDKNAIIYNKLVLNITD
jgi:hypothetical protein